MKMENLLTLTKNIPEELLNENIFVLIFMMFDNFKKYFPLLTENQKSILLNKFIFHESTRFISRMDLRDIELDFGETALIFDNLKELIIDDYNINQVISRCESFPSLTSIDIDTTVEINFDFSNFTKLKKIKIANTGERMKPCSDIGNLDIEDMFLSGFALSLSGEKLPKKLHLENCYVTSKNKLRGCEIMHLFSVIWEGVKSYPSHELYIEDIEYEYSDDLLELEVCHVNNSVFHCDFQRLTKLKSLRFTDNRSKNDLFYGYPDSLEKLYIDFYFVRNSKNPKISYPSSIAEFYMVNDKNDFIRHFNIPINTKKVLITGCFLSINDVLLNINQNKIPVEDLEISFSKIYEEHPLDNFVIPKDIKKLIIRECNIERSSTLSADEDQIVIVTRTPGISVKEYNREFCFGIDMMNMDETKFLKMCYSASKSTSYKDYFSTIRDIGNLEMIDEKKYKMFTKIFNSFPYSISGGLPQEGFDYFMTNAHKDSQIVIHGTYWSKEKLIETENGESRNS